MKDRTKKIIAVSSGVCVFALWFVWLFLLTRPYTEKVVIWLPDNYKLENIISNEVVSICPNFDESRKFDSVFYSTVDLDSFKELASKSKSEEVSVRIEDATNLGGEQYRVIYKIRYYIENNKSLIVVVVVAKEYYRYNKRALSEMRLRDGVLFLKNKRNTDSMYFFSILGFVVIVSVVFLYNRWV